MDRYGYADISLYASKCQAKSIDEMLDAQTRGSFFAVIQTNKSLHLFSASCLTALFPR